MTVPHQKTGSEAAAPQPEPPVFGRPSVWCHDRRSATVEEIALLARQSADTVADPTAVLSEVIKAVVDSEADPYVLLGVLAEGVVQTVARRIPAERRLFALQGFLNVIGSRTQIRWSR